MTVTPFLRKLFVPPGKRSVGHRPSAWIPGAALAMCFVASFLVWFFLGRAAGAAVPFAGGSGERRL